MILHRGFRMTPTAAPTRSPTKKLWQKPWYTLGAADRETALRALGGSRTPKI
jgi:ribulose bisphosphate carboxylase small subunit